MQYFSNFKVDRALLFPKAAYFLFYGAMASLAPFLPLYYEQLGLSGRQIGLLAGMPPLVMLFSASLFGGVADATQQHKRLLNLAIMMVAVAVLGISMASGFLWLIPVVLLFAFFLAPIMPLVDRTVLALLGERKNQYGKQRLWGALGWGIAALVAGLLVEQGGLRWAFYSFLVFWVILLVASFRLPVSRSSIGNQFWRGLSQLLKNRQWVVFLAVIFISGAGMSIMSNYLFLYLNELGASRSLMGFSLSVATISELVVMFFSDRLLERWGAKKLLILALVIFILRAFAYAFSGTPMLALFIQLLHGPSFAAMWVAGVTQADRMAPPGLGATTQGIFSGVTMGLGSAFGAMTGGLLYENFGAAATFMWAGFGMLFGLGLFVLADWGVVKLRVMLTKS
jgi:PPP family 3-phenylpropionic acid transporter